MRISNISIALALSLACIACTNTDTTDSYTDLFVADIESAKKNEKIALLSTYADKVSYIPLQTESVPLIENIHGLKYEGNTLAVVNFSNSINSRNILLFDGEGNYIRQIGAHGRGPGEYYLPYGVELFPNDSTIIVADNTGWLYKYAYSGNFIGRRRVDPFSSPLIKASDSTFLLLKSHEYSKYGHHKAIMFNKDLDSLDAYLDRSKLIGKRSLLMVYDRSYKIDGKIHLWDNVSDTTYFFSENKFSPAYMVRHTDEAMSFRERFSGKKLDFAKYENCLSNVSTSSNVFLWIMHKMERFNYIFDKNKGSGFRIMDSQKFPFSGLTNDIDGGISFWPQYQLSENIFYEIIYPSMILSRKDEFVQRAIENGLPQDSPFFKLLNSLDENSNPVIMLVEFK